MMIHTLMALRTALDGIQLQIDGLIADEQARIAQPTPGCQHAHTQSLATMGHPYHWRCKDCGYENDPQPDGALTGANEGGTDHG